MIKHIDELFRNVCSKSKKRLVAAWAVDSHTIGAVAKAIEMGFIEGTLVGDKKLIADVCSAEHIDLSLFKIIDNHNELASIAEAVSMVRNGEGDVLMKGLCSTDKFMRGILNKEAGLLPPKAVLSHVTLIENPNYHKLLLISDIAVIPAPDFKQKIALTKYLVKAAKTLGIEKPKVAVIAATEQMLAGMPACVEGAMIAKMGERGQIPGCIIDGPLSLDLAVSEEAVKIKKVSSQVAGDADCLLFPSIEAANVFYKTNTQLIPGVKIGAYVVGAMAPCVLSSRADSMETKLNSIAFAVNSCK